MAMCEATCAGCQMGSGITPVPSLMRSVRAIRLARKIMADGIGSPTTA